MIQHNKKLFWVIILLIALLIIVIFLIKKGDNKKESEAECKINSDCIAASCCHPDSCVSNKKAPVCNGTLCSMVCSGPLDCEAGYCGCIEGKCSILKK